MNLQHEWQNMNSEILLQSEKVTLENIRIDEQSHSLLQSLLFKLKWKMRWIRIISVAMLALAFFAKGDLRILLVAEFLSYEIFGAIALYQFNKIKTAVDYNSSTQQVLQSNLNAIKKILKIENIWGYIFLPLSGPAGLMAFLLYKYENIETVIASPNFILKLVLLSLLAIPLFFIAKKMNDSLFKAPIKDLEDKIQSFKNEG